MLHPQNGDRTVAMDSVTSLHPVYTERNQQNTLRSKATKETVKLNAYTNR